MFNRMRRKRKKINSSSFCCINNNNNMRNPKGMSFPILAESCYIVEEEKLFECFVLELV